MNPPRLKILVVSELSILKMFSGGAKTMGGIEVNHKNVMKHLAARGHEIRTNVPYPPWNPPDVIICPTFMPVAWYLVWSFKQMYKCAVVQHAHTTVEDMVGGFLPASMAGFGASYLRQLYGLSTILITPSNHSRRAIEALHLPSAAPVVPVSNGVDLAKFTFSGEKRAAFRAYLSRRFRVDAGKPVVLCVGVLWKRKGIDTFHDVAKQMADYEFVWVGNYIMDKKIKEQHDDLQNLTFTGYVPDIVAAYCGADVFFFPSRAENQGIPLLEAAACKLPIVCRDLPTYDWIQDGIHCLKARGDGEFPALIRGVVEDKAKHDRIARAALENVKAHEIGRVIDQVERIYRDAIKKNAMANRRKKNRD
ncbi:MAG: glycosyltransferase family 4 protein [Candidatus Lokiarchaeota archaeon]|nr:glycosyltransferase family 4 protein [Candidatus Lokiarchaeota archaeon]